MDAQITMTAGSGGAIQASSIDAHADVMPGFASILFETPADRPSDGDTPAYFGDLNCDQIVNAIIAGKEPYGLRPFFCGRLRRATAVRYRQDVMRDLDGDVLQRSVRRFASDMQGVRELLERARESYYLEPRQAWFLDAVLHYGHAIAAFADALDQAEIQSSGFRGWRAFIRSYRQSTDFRHLVSEAETLRANLAKVIYTIQVGSSRFTVGPYRDEPDYSAEIEACFEKFKQGAPRSYLVQYRSSDDLNHIEAKILEFVAKLHPSLFAALADFAARHADMRNATVLTFDREVQFYIAYLDYIAELRAGGLSFCYPEVSEDHKDVFVKDGFDLALAKKLRQTNTAVVGNDFHVVPSERVIVISGPNQGGKTTFARMFGQLHHFAGLGCPVPGRQAKLLIFDQLFSHFEKEERVENLRGKLEDDLMRARTIVDHATSRSIIILNEIFTSTTIQDEIFLSTKIMARILDLDALCVWVTFADELASFSPHVVSMVSTVLPDNPALRTFKIVRLPADGLAYAMAIARKYRLTYEGIRERVGS